MLFKQEKAMVMRGLLESCHLLMHHTEKNSANDPGDDSVIDHVDKRLLAPYRHPQVIRLRENC